jgi:hypothetical protein
MALHLPFAPLYKIYSSSVQCHRLTPARRRLTAIPLSARGSETSSRERLRWSRRSDRKKFFWSSLILASDYRMYKSQDMVDKTQYTRRIPGYLGTLSIQGSIPFLEPRKMQSSILLLDATSSADPCNIAPSLFSPLKRPEMSEVYCLHKFVALLTRQVVLKNSEVPAGRIEMFPPFSLSVVLSCQSPCSCL